MRHHRVPRCVRTSCILLALLLLPSAAAQTGSGVEVAVLDTGVDHQHPELEGRVERVGFVDYASLPDLPGLPDVDPGELERDPDGRGTATASVVAGGTLGVAPEAVVHDLQVDARYTQGVADPRAEQAAVEAMDWLLRHHGNATSAGPRVVLMSFAAAGVTPEGARTLSAQAERLWDEGVAVVVPVQGEWSALHESRQVLTVGADSECPTDAQVGLKPDLVADGGAEVAVPGVAGQDGGTTRSEGAHVAAARVAGVLALMVEARPDLPVDAQFQILRAAAADQGPEGPDLCSGFGLLDAEAAVAAAEAWEDPVAPVGAPTEDAPVPVPVVLVAVSLAVALVLRRRR